MISQTPVFLVSFILVQGLGLSILWRRLRLRPHWRPWVATTFAVGNLPWLIVFYYFAQAELVPGWLTQWVIRPFITWQAGVLLWLVTAGILTLDLLLFVHLPRRLARRLCRAPPATSAAPPDPSRRRFIANAARASVLVGAGGAAGWGLAHAGRPPRIVAHDLPFADLPRALEGLKIAHLTDLHIGIWTTAEEVGQAFEVARGLAPDLVVLTGDLIDHRPDFAQVLVDHLPLLERTPLGVFGVIGNHDVYTGANAVTAGLRGGGVVMLRDEHHSLARDGLPLTIAGVDDPGRGWLGAGAMPQIGAALAGAPKDQFELLLVHRPTAFDAARSARIPLTLCGHTHGGQYGIPGGPHLAQLAFEYSYGVYHRSGAVVHVSAGIGSVGLPFRLGMAPEIGLLTLVRG